MALFGSVATADCLHCSDSVVVVHCVSDGGPVAPAWQNGTGHRQEGKVSLEYLGTYDNLYHTGKAEAISCINCSVFVGRGDSFISFLLEAHGMLRSDKRGAGFQVHSQPGLKLETADYEATIG